GVLFERAYAAIPLTLPSHATLFTGLYPPEHGVRSNGESRLDDGIPTLAEVLVAEGYETAAFVGSFVLDSRFGLNRGFQTYGDQFVADATENDSSIPTRPRDGSRAAIGGGTQD